MSEHSADPSNSTPPAAWAARLNREDLAAEPPPADPLALFSDWFSQARAADLVDATAATLATADADARPSARTVLVKTHDADGFYFYTNYDSRKGHELAQNPRAALLFWWDTLERQVRIEGPVQRLTAAASDAYFERRPRDSQIGAHASRQSRPIAGRAELERAVEALESRFADQPVPRPAQWGGYCLTPERMEFWQGRLGRLHDRLAYRRSPTGWQVERLAP